MELTIILSCANGSEPYAMCFANSVEYPQPRGGRRDILRPCRFIEIWYFPFSAIDPAIEMPNAPFPLEKEFLLLSTPLVILNSAGGHPRAIDRAASSAGVVSIPILCSRYCAGWTLFIHERAVVCISSLADALMFTSIRAVLFDFDLPRLLSKSREDLGRSFDGVSFVALRDCARRMGCGAECNLEIGEG